MDTEHISMEVLRTIVCSVLAQLYHNDFLPAELSVSVQSYMSFLWFLLISLACHVIRTKKPNIWRIMCRRWLISDKEVGSELINKPLSPSYCYCKNFLVYFWQINIIFVQHMKVIFVQIFGNLRSCVNCTSDLNMVKITGTPSIYFDTMAIENLISLWLSSEKF